MTGRPPRLVLLSLGGNLGDRKALMDAAVDRLAALPETSLRARSSYYRTAPDGPLADQPWFVNLAVAIETGLPAATLARLCRDIEAALGRDRAREVAWGPRPVDIDIVAEGSAAEMMAPGGELDERPFVLVPAAEIAGDARIGGTTLRARAGAAGGTGVRRLDWPPP